MLFSVFTVNRLHSFSTSTSVTSAGSVNNEMSYHLTLQFKQKRLILQQLGQMTNVLISTRRSHLQHYFYKTVHSNKFLKLKKQIRNEQHAESQTVQHIKHITFSKLKYQLNQNTNMFHSSRNNVAVNM